MVGLLDIRPKSGTFKIDDETDLDLVALTFEQIAMLLETHPILTKVLSGGVRESDFVKDFISKAPEAAGALIAAVCGKMADKQYEKAARDNIGAGMQFEIIQAGLKLTFPRGTRPFLEAAEMLSGSSAQASDMQAMNSPKPSSNSKGTFIPPSGSLPPDRPVPSSSSKANSTPPN